MRRERLKSMTNSTEATTSNSVIKLIHNVMNYTGLPASNCHSILAALSSQNWSEFTFQLSRSIVAKYSYDDFPITPKTIVVKDESSVVSIYNLFCKFNESTEVLDLVDVGKQHTQTKHQIESSITTDYQSTQTVNLQVLQKFQSELLILATAFLNSIKGYILAKDIPVFQTTTKGKQSEVIALNLIPYHDQYVPKHDHGFRVVQLTGVARVSIDGKNFQPYQVIHDLSNFNLTNKLEYQWRDIYSKALGWVSPIQFQQLLNPIFLKDYGFYAITEECINKDGSIYQKLTHAYFSIIEEAATPNLTGYYPARDDDDDDCYYPDQFAFITSEFISYSFQTSDEYYHLVDAFNNECDDFQNSNEYFELLSEFEDGFDFEDSEEYDIALDEFENIIRSELSSDYFQTTQSYFDALNAFESQSIADFKQNKSSPTTYPQINQSPDCAIILYKHIGKVFYIGMTHNNKLSCWRIRNNEPMHIYFRNEVDLVADCYYTGKEYVIANFIAKYW